ncbi:MAG TPA: cell division protein FtsL [Persephonella sp.]|uniref:Cell division protein FtsL n=1 Tax=Persephonella marina (strain DSM 14350 / EX-H1) TaxID=123214 RepID=C0QP67_PERMH|nr:MULTISPECIES: cell division protein FtsL [Persephonella]ACO03757.1 cell division protein FtsL [Persephonella marina EX-H1]HCB69921.1 cell division protein FtsL [Persephonella sp.]
MGRALGLELKKDLAVIKKYVKYWIIIISVTFGLVMYNSLYFKTERDITQLVNKKNYLEAKNLQLKKEITRLSSPERISDIAKKRLKMKAVDYSRVHFIDLN